MRTKKYTDEELKQHRAEYMRKYQQAHKEELSKYSKEYWLQNKDKIVKKRKESKSQTQYQRKWYENNREKWNAYLRERRNKINKGEKNE